MSGFRGQYMDMVHPSSDVKLADKPNHADKQPVKAPAPVVSTDLPEGVVKALDQAFGHAEEETTIDTYESPFLPDVEVEKRPLGGSPGIENDAHDTFDINDFIDLSKPELPADDGGQGELEPELPSGDKTKEPPVEITPLIEPKSPFAHASDTTDPAMARKPFPIWGWILLFVMIAVAGVAAGALIYLSGWLS